MYRAPSASQKRDKSLTIYNPFAFNRDSIQHASFQGPLPRLQSTPEHPDEESKQLVRRLSKSIHVEIDPNDTSNEKNELLYQALVKA